VGAFGADVERAVFVSEFGLALWTGWQGTHDDFLKVANDDCRQYTLAS
jgi:hypothetical protein